jgi:hypothetical protein
VLHFDYVLQLFFLCNKELKPARPEPGRTKKKTIGDQLCPWINCTIELTRVLISAAFDIGRSL